MLSLHNLTERNNKMRFLFKWEILTNRTNIVIIGVTAFLLNHMYWHLLIAIPLLMMSRFIGFIIGYKDLQEQGVLE